MKPIEKIRKEMAVIILNHAMGEVRAVTDSKQKLKLPNINETLDELLAVKVGGEVWEDCNDCYGDGNCLSCHGSCKISRPKTVKDKLMEGS